MFRLDSSAIVPLKSTMGLSACSNSRMLYEDCHDSLDFIQYSVSIGRSKPVLVGTVTNVRGRR